MAEDDLENDGKVDLAHSSSDLSWLHVAHGEVSNSSMLMYLNCPNGLCSVTLNANFKVNKWLNYPSFPSNSNR